MSTTTINMDVVELLAPTPCVPGTPQRVTRNMVGKLGGVLTVKMTNGATPPTAQCVARVYIAHTTGATPAAAAEGTTWKLLAELGGGGTVANAPTPLSLVLPPVCHIQVEFAGNTVQNVTVEAQLTEHTSMNTAG